MDLSQLDTRDQHEEGVDVEIINPQNDEPLGLTIKVAGPDSKRYRKAQAKLRQARLKRRYRGGDALEDEENISLLGADHYFLDVRGRGYGQWHCPALRRGSCTEPLSQAAVDRPAGRFGGGRRKPFFQDLSATLGDAVEAFKGGGAAEIPGGGERAWEAFLALDNARSFHGMGPNPISFADILAWQILMGEELEPWELRALALMDGAALSAMLKGGKTAKPSGNIVEALKAKAHRG